jgi:hypothetical protein
MVSMAEYHSQARLSCSRRPKGEGGAQAEAGEVVISARIIKITVVKGTRKMGRGEEEGEEGEVEEGEPLLLSKLERRCVHKSAGAGSSVQQPSACACACV